MMRIADTRSETDVSGSTRVGALKHITATEFGSFQWSPNHDSDAHFDNVSDETREHERMARTPLAHPAWSWRRICEVRIAVAHSQIGLADHPWIGAVY